MAPRPRPGARRQSSRCLPPSVHGSSAGFGRSNLKQSEGQSVWPLALAPPALLLLLAPVLSHLPPRAVATNCNPCARRASGGAGSARHAAAAVQVAWVQVLIAAALLPREPARGESGGAPAGRLRRTQSQALGLAPLGGDPRRGLSRLAWLLL